MTRPVLTVKVEPANEHEDIFIRGDVHSDFDAVATALAASMHSAPNPWGLYGLAQRDKDNEQ